MAVPTDAYQTYSLRDTVSDTQRQVFKFAKLTSPYSTVADAKTLFKLDGVINEGTSSFIGYVEKNSTNYAYHSPVRMDSYLFGDSHILLTDGGLNTYGDATVLSVLSDTSTNYTDNPIAYKPRINDTAVWGSYKSAYYLSSIPSIQVLSPDSGDWNDMGQGTAMAENETSIQKRALLDYTVVNRAGSYSFRTKIQNDEGIFYSPQVLADIYRTILTMKYDATYASYAYNGSTTKTIYSNTPEIMATGGGVEGDATSFAKNDVINMASGDIADYGYYTLGENWYRFEYSVIFEAPLVVEKGFCTKWGWPSTDPAYQFEPEFSSTVAIETEEATFAVINKTLELTAGTASYSTTPPTFPNAAYNIYINGSVALINTNLYFYLKDELENYYYLGTANTGTGATKEVTFTSTFATLGHIPSAGEIYQVYITDTQL